MIEEYWIGDMKKEEVINVEIGKLLERYLHDAKVYTEENDQLLNVASRPDCVIVGGGRETVLLENKIDSERELIEQCQERLKATWQDGSPVKAVVGLLSPSSLAKSGSRNNISKNQEFRWATWGATLGRLPQKGWLQGSILELAGFIDRVGANAVSIDELIDKIRAVLKQSSLVINRDKNTSDEFSKILKQRPSEQTNRMGLAMIFNGIVFQAHIARHHRGVSSPSQMRGEEKVNQADLVRAWTQILEINYSPIFLKAKELLQSMPDARIADSILNLLFKVAIDVSKETGSQGLIGTIFGELIRDRKLLASFYTMPQSSALIAELAVNRLAIDWDDKNQIEKLRIADFAVGTGTLLIAAYKRIAERYLLKSNNPEKLHKAVMESVMIGCDIDPSAVHITASRLSGEYPDIDYSTTNTYVMPYGYVKLKLRSHEYKLGSLDLFEEEAKISLFGSGLAAISSNGQEKHAEVNIPKESLDIVIMNPPFTRPTGHEGFKEGTPNPSFASLGNSDQDQRAMSKVLKSYLKKLTHQPASHGNAGLVSNFMDLAHVKLKDKGILALITPTTVISGEAWSNLRELLSKHYSDITIVTISAKGKYGRNWSADTSMDEAIIVAKKSTEDNTNRATFIALNKRPSTITEAVELAKLIQTSKKRGSLLKLGDTQVGWVIQSNFGKEVTGHPSGIRHADLAKFVNKLSKGTLTLPQLQDIDIPIVNLGDLGNMGAYHADINGKNQDGSYRGPFDVDELKDRDEHSSVSYPILWSHETAQEKHMVVKPDMSGDIRLGCQEKALQTWAGYTSNRRVAGATRLHINRDLSTQSQSLGACITPEPAIGGHAWPSVGLNVGGNLEKYEKIMTLWLNTTLGLITRWWVSNRQQMGRSRLSMTTIANIPVVDINQFSKEKVEKTANLFDKYSEQPLRSAYLADEDPVRQSLDSEFCDILKLPKDVLPSLKIIRKQWCSESSVKGSKA